MEVGARIDAMFFLIYLVYETNLTRAFDFLRCWCGTWVRFTPLILSLFSTLLLGSMCVVVLTDETAFLLSQL
jgi:hypothetical protein